MKRVYSKILERSCAVRSELPGPDILGERSSSDRQAASQLLIRAVATSIRVNFPALFESNRLGMSYLRVLIIATFGEVGLPALPQVGSGAPVCPTCLQNHLHSPLLLE